MRQKNIHAFTLVEMMIVISLFFILLTFAYLPYSHYQEKLKIRQAIREASQTILGSRNLAINGYDENIGGTFENRGLAVYFDTNDNTNVQIYSYGKDHEFTDGDVVNLISSSGNEYQTRKLPTGTQFEGIVTRDYARELNNEISTDANSAFDLMSANGILFYYKPITGDSHYFTVDGGILSEITSDHVFLEFSYKGANSSVLRKILQYDTRVHIIDYGKGVTEL